MSNRNLLLTVPEVGSLRAGCQRGQVLARALQTAHVSLCPHGVEGELSGASFVRALIPFMRAPPLRPNYSQRHLLTPSR